MSSSAPAPEEKKPRLELEEPAPEDAAGGAIVPLCPFGATCYRKNPVHFKEMKHVQLEELYAQIVAAGDQLENHSMYKSSEQFQKKEDLLQQLRILRGVNGLATGIQMAYHEPKKPARDMLSKWNSSCPYNFFLTSLSVEQDKHFSIGFRDLLHPSLGPIKETCHFNFMIELEWVVDHTIAAGLEGKPMTLIYGEGTPELRNANSVFPWITTQQIRSPFPFGSHHTKLSLIKYEDDSLRFIVSTANLIESDWEKRTQGLWVSPRCPSTPAAPSDGESPTNFRQDLVQYLSTYATKHVTPWVGAIRSSDCSQIKVAFIGSAPVTSATSTNGFEWGHKKVEKLLKASQIKVGTDWPLILQCSSIGSLGPDDAWLRHEIGASMSSSGAPTLLSNVKTPIQVIFPSHQNVLNSFDGVYGGGCLPYSFDTHAKQTWFRSYLHQWKSDLFGRTLAVPHIKSYARLSPDCTRLAWFLLTSANLSKAAWGRLNKARSKLAVMSWEAGVLFLPKHFGNDCETFEVGNNNKSAEEPPAPGVLPPFRLPFDVPATKYENGDRPWIIEALKAAQAGSSSDSED